jgi:hypothetical protein
MRTLDEINADWCKVIKEHDEANLQYREAKDNLASDVNARIFNATHDKLKEVEERMLQISNEHREYYNKQDE